MVLAVIIISIMGPVIGGLAIRRMEKSGKYGVVFMPLIGLGIGIAIRAAWGSGGWPGVAAAIIAYLAAMATHVPSAYEMFRQDFGGFSCWFSLSPELYGRRKIAVAGLRIYYRTCQALSRSDVAVDTTVE